MIKRWKILSLCPFSEALVLTLAVVKYLTNTDGFYSLSYFTETLHILIPAIIRNTNPLQNDPINLHFIKVKVNPVIIKSNKIT